MTLSRRVLYIEDDSELRDVGREVDPHGPIVMLTAKAENRWGLGLAISEEIPHLHETELSIESREGEGATVSFEWPEARTETASENQPHTP